MRQLIRHRQGVIHAITPNNGNRRFLKGAHFARKLGGSTSHAIEYLVKNTSSTIPDYGEILIPPSGLTIRMHGFDIWLVDHRSQIDLLIAGDTITIGTVTVTLTAPPIKNITYYSMQVAALPVIADGVYVVSAEQNSTPFDPGHLFLLGEQGAWYDPSDLTTMFQDSAGTTPVTADGQPVGKILDKSGRGNHATQSTAAARPLYKTDGTYHWLQFDGVDDSLSTAAINFMATDKMSQFYGVKRNTNTYGFVVEGGLNALSTQGSIGFAGGGWASAGAKYGAAMSGTSGAFSYDTDASYSAPITNVVSVQNDIALTNNYDELKLRINGVANSSGTYSSNPNVTGTFGNNIIYIGSRSSSSLFLSGNIYSLILLGRLATTQEVTDTETWVNSKTGAY